MKVERVLCRRASQLIAVSEAQRGSLIEHYGISPDRIATIVNGGITAIDPAESLRHD